MDLIHTDGTLLAQSRQDLARAALKTNGDRFLWLDADMVFPPDSLDRLVDHPYDIVGASYANRRKPIRSTASKNGKRIDSSLGKTGCEDVDALGMGLCLIHRKVFEQTTQPWFTTAWVIQGETQQIVSEDVYFFRKAKEQGFQAYVDHELSQDTMHIGSYLYSHSDITTSH